MKRTSKKILAIISVFALMFAFTACRKNSKTNKNIHNSEQLNVEDFWNNKVRYLCETDCEDFASPEKLKKEYILKVCQYYKTLSESNIEYNSEIKRYIISEIELQDIVKNIFGIENFEYKNNKHYNSTGGFYMFKDYYGFFDDESYENEQINKLDDERIEFKITVKDGKTGLKNNKTYILKKGDKGSYYITSLSSEK